MNKTNAVYAVLGGILGALLMGIPGAVVIGGYSSDLDAAKKTISQQSAALKDCTQRADLFQDAAVMLALGFEEYLNDFPYGDLDITAATKAGSDARENYSCEVSK